MEKSTLRKMKKMLAMVSAFSCGMMSSLSSYAEVTDDKTSENTFLHSFIDAVNGSVENHFTDENMSLETETISDGMHVEEIEVLEEEEVLDDSHEVDLKAVSSHLVKQFTVDDIEIANEAILTYVLSYTRSSLNV